MIALALCVVSHGLPRMKSYQGVLESTDPSGGFKHAALSGAGMVSEPPSDFEAEGTHLLAPQEETGLGTIPTLSPTPSPTPSREFMRR